ncbi:MAG: hypothetical protein CMJ85_07295 [Planctomycetes bacterium]|nr:hypothetical protein [Planctomycetota bacterium]
MRAVFLRFPALVRVRGEGSETAYTVRPLLVPAEEGRLLEGHNRKYSRATKDCLRLVRRRLDRIEVDRAKNLDLLLWHRFDPILTARTFELSCPTGRETLQGHFLAVWFEVGDYRYVCLPGFDGHLFIARPGRKRRYDMAGEVQRVVQHLLREERLRFGDNAPHPKEHLSRKGDFVTSVSTSVSVMHREIELRPRFEVRLLGLQTDRVVSGWLALAHVGEALSEIDEDELFGAHGRVELTDRLHAILFESPPSATVLVGPSGVGKTAILHAALSKYQRGHKHVHPEKLQGVWRIDPTRLISGMSGVGAWQRQCEAIFTYIEKRLPSRKKPPTDVLYFDNPVALLRVGASAQNRMVVADVLKPYLEKGALTVLAECTPEAWNVIQDKDRGFADLFRVVRVPEPNTGQALEMVIQRCSDYERRHGCRFDLEVLERAFELGRMSRGNRAMPARVVDFLGSLATRYARNPIGLETFDKAYRTANRISGRILDPREQLDDRELQSFIEQKLIGQGEARTAIADVIHTIKARLTDPEAPAASLLFVGPTGVGKTEAAKVLAEYLFDDPQCLVRFDMNEFVDPAAAGRLVGDFLQPEGQLTSRVRQRPFCLLLFDEIEKAPPAVHDLLLQLLGEGRLSDAVGRTTDFSNCVVVMTSNLGAEKAGPGIGFEGEPGSCADAYRRAAAEFFRPELFNRIDRLVVFGPLDRNDLRRIARLQLARVLERHGFVQRSSFLEVSDAVLDHLVEIGFDPRMGARALKRVIEKEITSMAAEKLIAMPTEQAVMIHLFACDGRLIADVSPVEPAESVDPDLGLEIPAGAAGAPLYRSLIEVTGEALAELNDCRSLDFDGIVATEDDSPLMSMREGFVHLRQHFHEILESCEASNLPRCSAFTGRVRTTRKGKWGGHGAERARMLSKLHFQEHLESMYQTAKVVQGDERPAEDCLDLSILRHRSRWLLRRRSFDYQITVRPLLKDAGRSRVCTQWLVDQYIEVCNRMLRTPNEAQGGVPEKPHVDAPIDIEVFRCEDSSSLTLAFQLSELHDCFATEAGTHIFCEPYSGPLAIVVEVDTLEEPTAQPGSSSYRDKWIASFEQGKGTLEEGKHRPPPVVRVYSFPGGGLPGTVSDLRTGLLCRFHSFASQLPHWFYHALPVDDRLPLGGTRT